MTAMNDQRVLATMQMDSLAQLLQSYLNVRAAVLRAIEDSRISDEDIETTLRITYSTAFRRRKNPDSWRPAELALLAATLSLPTAPFSRLEKLADQLVELPAERRYSLMKACQLDNAKLQARRRDFYLWQHKELERMTSVLRNQR